MRTAPSAIVLGALLAFSQGLAGQEKPLTATPASKRERVLGVARQVMAAARFCTLVTIGDLGQPQARIVDPLEPNAALAVYIATNPRSRKVAEIRRDPRVTLLYFDTARSAYVTLIGPRGRSPGRREGRAPQEGLGRVLSRGQTGDLCGVPDRPLARGSGEREGRIERRSFDMAAGDRRAEIAFPSRPGGDRFRR